MLFCRFISENLTKSLNEREAEKESILDDIEFETELVKQVEVNVGYIPMLVRRVSEGETIAIVSSGRRIATFRPPEPVDSDSDD